MKGKSSKKLKRSATSSGTNEVNTQFAELNKDNHDLSGAESEPEWEESTGFLKNENATTENSNLTISFAIKSNENEREVPAGKNEKKVVNRASAWDKECAKIIHRTHILCVLSRTIAISKSIDDPLLQSALVSIMPSYLHNFDIKNRSNHLKPLLSWFSRLFRLVDEEDFPSIENFMRKQNEQKQLSLHELYLSKLMYALENRVATNEMVVAMFVSLCRALDLNTRFLSVLDVSSVKPDSVLIDMNKKIKEEEKNKRSRKVSKFSILSPQASTSKPEETFSYKNLAKILSNSLSKSINLSFLSSKDMNFSGGRSLSPLFSSPTNTSFERALKSGSDSSSLALPLKQQHSIPRKRFIEVENNSLINNPVKGMQMNEIKHENDKQHETKIKHSMPNISSLPTPSRKNLNIEKKMVETGAHSEEMGSRSDQKLTENKGKKRKGDEEFERELQVAMLATSASTETTKLPENSNEKDTSNSVNPLIQEFNSSSSEKGKIEVIPKLDLKSMINHEEKVETTNNFSTFRNEKLMGKKVGGGNFWAKKKNFILNWAEIFYEESNASNEKEMEKVNKSNEDLSRRWICVDVIRNSYDDAKAIETSFSVHKNPLRYVIAFNQNNVKDVTRRYISHWSKISSLRIEESWLEKVLKICQENLATENTNLNPILPQPSYQSEAQIQNQKLNHGQGSTPLHSQLDSFDSDTINLSTGPILTTQFMNNTSLNSKFSEIDALEDMELQVKTLTEPFPKNQTDFKNHHLYALKKFLKRDEIIFPQNSILGFINGEPIYPRTSVKKVFSKQKWYKEGKIVKEGETPLKIVKLRKRKINQKSNSDWDGSAQKMLQTENEWNDELNIEFKNENTFTEMEKDALKDIDDVDSDFKQFDLFGEWQTVDYEPPMAIDGIVPKNQHGNVELWSHKFLPRGTVYINLPRIASLIRKLGFDFAPAMTGFEFKNGKMHPKMDGVVVCKEHEDIIYDAYNEEKKIREEEDEKRKRFAAMHRWRALLNTVITRERLRKSYEENQNHSATTDFESTAFKSKTFISVPNEQSIEIISNSDEDVKKTYDKNKKNHGNKDDGDEPPSKIKQSRLIQMENLKRSKNRKGRLEFRGGSNEDSDYDDFEDQHYDGEDLPHVHSFPKNLQTLIKKKEIE